MDGARGFRPWPYSRPAARQSDAGNAAQQGLLERRNQHLAELALGNADAKVDRAGDAVRAETNLQHMDQVVRELAATKKELALKEEELNQTRITRLTVEHGLGPAEIADPASDVDATDHTIATLQNALNAATRGPNARVPSGGAYGLGASIWSNTNRAAELPGEQNAAGPPDGWTNARNLFEHATTTPAAPQTIAVNINGRHTNLVHLADLGPIAAPQLPMMAGARPVLPPMSTPYSLAPIIVPPPYMDIPTGMVPTPRSPTSMRPMPAGTSRARPSRLSPTAAEFSVVAHRNWNPAPSFLQASNGNNHRLSTQELSAAGDWHAMTERVVFANDQQASIVMQQKIKTLDASERARMCESFLQYTALLITNRFGNFLVQRCLEFGNPTQVNILKAYITGKVVVLSKDPFGCHVIQKAFDTTPEDYKEGMIHELIGSIPETVIHRYACHVWQKLFELRWNRPDPIRVMDYVNTALRGTWKDVAQGETGSLVVQNIFENCHMDDKRMAINEVLANLDEIARGQYGNWCVQHICEHGYDHDRVRAINHILDRAVQYSLDQYASKVVEKCLKIADFDFLPRYLDKVCRPVPSRPRIPLIDIAGDQYGNYLVQWILMNAVGPNRDLVVSHVRRHMVSLRGSKYGSRVAMGCTNHKSETRPGPPNLQQNQGRFNNGRGGQGGQGQGGQGGGAACNHH